MSIIKSLYDYQVWADSQASDIKPSCAKIELTYLLRIDHDGNCLGLVDLRDRQSKKKPGKFYILPAPVTRSGLNAYKTPNLGWDARDYVLGAEKKSGADKEELYTISETGRKKAESFASLIADMSKVLTGAAQMEAQAISAFYLHNGLEAVRNDPLFADCCSLQSCRMSIVVGKDNDVPFAARSEVLAYASQSRIAAQEDQNGVPDGAYCRCMVSGDLAPIAVIHPSTPIAGSQATAKLASWQKDSGYDSHGKEQGYNAPVSVRAADMYSRAFLHLSKSSENTLRLGAETCIFWTQPRQPLMEQFISDVIQSVSKDKTALRDKLVSIYTYLSDPTTYLAQSTDLCRLYILTPNRSRIAVRYERECTIGEVVSALRQHFDDCAVKDSSENVMLSPVNHLFLSLTLDGKLSKLPQSWYSSYVASIFDRVQYPICVYQALIRRIKTEANVPTLWAGAVRGYLVRSADDMKGSVPMALNDANFDSGYLSGRVFALVEKCVADNAPNIASVFGLKHFSQAMAMPGIVLPQILRVYQRQISNSPYLSRQIDDVMSHLDHLPLHADLQCQGEFALGYYQQKQALYRKKSADDSADQTADSAE